MKLVTDISTPLIYNAIILKYLKIYDIKKGN
jgi:hypothetical protein